MAAAAIIFVLLLAATFGIAWVGGMDYQRFGQIQRDKAD